MEGCGEGRGFLRFHLEPGWKMGIVEPHRRVRNCPPHHITSPETPHFRAAWGTVFGPIVRQGLFAASTRTSKTAPRWILLFRDLEWAMEMGVSTASPSMWKPHTDTTCHSSSTTSLVGHNWCFTDREVAHSVPDLPQRAQTASWQAGCRDGSQERFQSHRYTEVPCVQ